MNCKIHPILYKFYLQLHELLGAELVHRRQRESSMSIEIIYNCDDFLVVTGRLNTLPEAEACGFWVMCRKQTRRGRSIYQGRQVYQLFLTPVHPKKRREMVPVITPLNAISSEAMMA